MSILDQVKTTIEAAIPDATATVRGGGGHFEIEVVSPAFAGKRILDKQRMVLQTLNELMAGADAPVHAIDRLVCKTP